MFTSGGSTDCFGESAEVESRRSKEQEKQESKKGLLLAATNMSDIITHQWLKILSVMQFGCLFQTNFVDLEIKKTSILFVCVIILTT